MVSCMVNALDDIKCKSNELKWSNNVIIVKLIIIKNKPVIFLLRDKPLDGIQSELQNA